MMMMTITITPDLPYFRATADCDWASARRLAKELGAEHVEAVNLAEVEAYVASHDDDSDHDDAELERMFRLAYGRAADSDDRKEGLWSHVCDAVQ